MFMTSGNDMAERHARAFAELSELGMALARDLQARALAAADDDTAQALGRAFHAVARTVRQTMALEARLARDAVRHAREAAEAAEIAGRDRPARSEKRRAEIREVLVRHIWTEAENEDIGLELTWAMDEMLKDAMVSTTFLDRPLEVWIEKIRGEIDDLAAAFAAEDAEAAQAAAAPEPEPVQPGSG